MRREQRGVGGALRSVMMRRGRRWGRVGWWVLGPLLWGLVPAAGRAQGNDCSLAAVERSVVTRHQMPALQGCRLVDVADGLRRSEVKVNQQTTRSAVEAGTIVSQAPAAGSSVFPGAGITLGISDGLASAAAKQPGGGYHQPDGGTKQPGAAYTPPQAPETDGVVPAVVAPAAPAADAVPPRQIKEIFVPSADLDVTVEPLQGPAARAGKTLQVRVTVANLGPTDARLVQLRTVKSTNFTVEQASGPCPGLPCTLALLPAGGLVDVTLIARVSEAGSYNAAFTATSPSRDPNRANNTARIFGMAKGSVDWVEVGLGGLLLTALGAAVVWRLGPPLPAPVPEVLLDGLTPATVPPILLTIPLRVHVSLGRVAAAPAGEVPVLRRRVAHEREMGA